MNETVIKLLVKNVKAFKKILKNKDRKKRAKYKVYQKRINILYYLLNNKGRNYIVQGEL
jgi:steroid 5-alpha reductase family enzyme